MLVGTNLFHPLYGGGEKALIEWLIDLQKRDIILQSLLVLVA